MIRTSAIVARATARFVVKAVSVVPKQTVVKQLCVAATAVVVSLANQSRAQLCVVQQKVCNQQNKHVFFKFFHTYFVDLCDAVEYCNHGSCPDDVKHTSDHICRPPRGACDFPEVCDGMITKTNIFFCLKNSF